MARRFNTVVGVSDHTLGISIPLPAVALGVKIVERQFILDRRLGGSDSSFSLEPGELKTIKRGYHFFRMRYR